jgi:hypothetical protein
MSVPTSFDEAALSAAMSQMHLRTPAAPSQEGSHDSALQVEGGEIPRWD